ncbi:Beta-galactosidase, partial [termite gut metagenome]
MKRYFHPNSRFIINVFERVFFNKMKK